MEKETNIQRKNSNKWEKIVIHSTANKKLIFKIIKNLKNLKLK